MVTGKQITGVEPASPAWEASVLPMNHICIFLFYLTIIHPYGLEMQGLFLCGNPERTLFNHKICPFAFIFIKMFIPIKQSVNIFLFSCCNCMGTILYSIFINDGSKVIYRITYRMLGLIFPAAQSWTASKAFRGRFSFGYFSSRLPIDLAAKSNAQSAITLWLCSWNSSTRSCRYSESFANNTWLFLLSLICTSSIQFIFVPRIILIYMSAQYWNYTLIFHKYPYTLRSILTYKKEPYKKDSRDNGPALHSHNPQTTLIFPNFRNKKPGSAFLFSGFSFSFLITDLPPISAILIPKIFHWAFFRF